MTYACEVEALAAMHVKIVVSNVSTCARPVMFLSSHNNNNNNTNEK